jgi:hypothetical protein
MKTAAIGVEEVKNNGSFSYQVGKVEFIPPIDH